MLPVLLYLAINEETPFRDVFIPSFSRIFTILMIELLALCKEIIRFLAYCDSFLILIRFLNSSNFKNLSCIIASSGFGCRLACAADGVQLLAGEITPSAAQATAGASVKICECDEI